MGKKHLLKQKHLSELETTNGDSQIFSSLWKVNKAILSSAVDFQKLTEEVVNVVLQELNYLKIGYRISVLTLVDYEGGFIKRISFSPTPEALEILKKANVRFHDIKIPLAAKENLLVRSLNDQKVYITHDLSDVFYPEKDRDTWRSLQHQVGIKTTLVFPLILNGKSIGAMIFSLSKKEDEISSYEKNILSGFTDAVAVAIENANLYRQLEFANKKLKDLDKLKDEFLSVAAHELRAPMTAIKGYLSMIIEGDVSKNAVQTTEFLYQASEANDRLIRLVNNMLNISRIEEGRLVFQMGFINLVNVIRTVFNEFKNQAYQKGLEISLDIQDKINDKVYVDQDRIHEVVANLVSNAIKYTDKGSVIIRVLQPNASKIRVEVVDSGAGVSEEEQKQLFQKFFRAESSSGKVMGTGLGLYIAKLLVNKFGGEIGIISKTGEGSTFWFELSINESRDNGKT